MHGPEFLAGGVARSHRAAGRTGQVAGAPGGPAAIDRRVAWAVPTKGMERWWAKHTLLDRTRAGANNRRPWAKLSGRDLWLRESKVGSTTSNRRRSTPTFRSSGRLSRR